MNARCLSNLKVPTLCTVPSLKASSGRGFSFSTIPQCQRGFEGPLSCCSTCLLIRPSHSCSGWLLSTSLVHCQVTIDRHKGVTTRWLQPETLGLPLVVHRDRVGGGWFEVAILLSGHCTDAVKATRSGKHIRIDDPQRAWTNLKLECYPRPSYVVKMLSSRRLDDFRHRVRLQVRR